MLAYGAGFDASWRPPRLHVDRNLTAGDVAWLNGQLELVDKPAVRFAREIALPPAPSGIRPPADTSWIRMSDGRGVHVMGTEMAHGYEPPSMSLLPPPERIC